MRETICRTLCLGLLASLGPSAVAADQLVVGAADFHSRSESGYYFEPNPGWIEGSLANGGDGCLVATAALPHGARLEGMLLQVYDNRAENFTVELKRKRRGNSVPAESLGGASTSGASASVQEISVGSPIAGHVVEDAFVYFLSTAGNCLDGANHRIYAVRIDYALTLFADGFESGDTSKWGAPPPTSFIAWSYGIDFKGLQGEDWLFDESFGIFWLLMSHGDLPCAIGPVELPHGATVTGFLANLYDGRSDRDLSLTLRRAPIASAVVPSLLASSSTSGSAGWQLRSDFTVANAVIDLDSYWYWYDACPSGDDVFAGELGVQAISTFYTLP